MIRRIFNRILNEALNICRSEYQLFKLRRSLKGQSVRIAK
jgi:hypothetical protein